MTTNLPQLLRDALAPLFTALPPEQAMHRLVVTSRPADREHLVLVEQALQQPALANRPDLAAGLWLYVDELDRSHTLSQGIHSSTGSFWHAIMHRREGDFSNSKYWYRKVGQHPALHHDPYAFVDHVERAQADDAALVTQQRREWTDLFQWCAAQ